MDPEDEVEARTQSPRSGRSQPTGPKLGEYGSAEDNSIRELVDELLGLAQSLRARAHDLDPHGKAQWMETATWAEIAEWAAFMQAVGEEIGA